MGSHYKEILRLFLTLETEKEVQRLLEDILTPQELRSIVERWRIVKSLSDGKSQREVQKELGCGIMTVTRGAQVLKNGSGGFRLALERVKKMKKR